MRHIADGKLKPGDPLPSESELSERFGVGRSSIREAMRALQLLRVVEVIQGKGTFVREPSIVPLVVDWTRIGQLGLVSDVMEARQFIEVLLAQLAAERASEEDIRKLRAAIKRSERGLTDMDASVQSGVEFHLTLADAAHNQVLALMYRTIQDLYLDVARQTRVTPEVAHDRLHDHEDLLQAIEDRDPEAAARIMKEHLDKAYRILSARESPVSDAE